MKRLKIYTQDIIDPETEIHYAFHRSIKEITIRHTHDFYEIFLVTKGKLIHTINAAEFILEKGSLVLIRPSDIHNFMKYEKSTCEIINLAFPPKTLMELFNYLGKGFESERLLKSRFAPSKLLTETEKNILKQKFERLHLLPIREKDRIKTRLRILLAEILSTHFSKENWKEKSTMPEWLEETVTEMQKKENFVQGIKIMADISGKTKEHLSREFKRSFEITPTKFINNLKLNYSANLLTSTDESIPFISFESGFENLSHFYHLFKLKYDISPKRFRQLKRKNSIPG